jgi:hypothetical protein
MELWELQRPKPSNDTSDNKFPIEYKQCGPEAPLYHWRQDGPKTICLLNEEHKFLRKIRGTTRITPEGRNVIYLLFLALVRYESRLASDSVHATTLRDMRQKISQTLDETLPRLEMYIQEDREVYEDSDDQEKAIQIEQIEKDCRKDESYRLQLQEMLQDLEKEAKSTA